MYKPKDYQHPRDRALLGQLLEMHAVGQLFDWCRKNQADRALVYAYRASCPEINAATLPAVYDMVLRACEMFETEAPPLCFLTHDYDARVTAAGLFSPILLLSDTYIQRADEACLYGAIAGQVGGIALGHQRGIGLTWLFDNISGLLPIPGVAVKAAEVLLNQWKRWRWFSCDRACLLATGSEEATLRTLFDLSVPEDILHRMRLGTPNDDYIAQYHMFTDASAASELVTMLNSMQSDTPWTPERYRELRSFCETAFASEGGTEGEDFI